MSHTLWDTRDWEELLYLLPSENTKDISKTLPRLPHIDISLSWTFSEKKAERLNSESLEAMDYDYCYNELVFKPSALRIAIRREQPHIVDLLLQKMHVLAIRAIDGFGQNALHVAVQSSSSRSRSRSSSRSSSSSAREEIVFMLLQYSPDFAKAKTFLCGSTPLHLAFKYGCLREAKILLDFDPMLANARNKNGNTVLHEAARVGEGEFIELILQKNTQLIHCVNDDGETALHCALCFVESHVSEQHYLKRRKIIDLLLRSKPELIDITDKEGRNVLQFSILYGNAKEVEYFLSLSPNLVNKINKKGRNVLFSALGEEDSLMKMLLSKMKQHIINCIDHEGQNILHEAIAITYDEQSEKIFELILQNLTPATVNSMNTQRQSILLLAVKKNAYRLVEMILPKTTPETLEKADGYGFTPLYYAMLIARDDLSILNLLLAARPKLVETVNKDGGVLHWAIEMHHYRHILPVLIQRATRKTMSALDCQARTALHILVEKKSHDKDYVFFACRLVSKMNLKTINVFDCKEKTAFRLAAQIEYCRSQGMIELLQYKTVFGEVSDSLITCGSYSLLERLVITRVTDLWFLNSDLVRVIYEYLLDVAKIDISFIIRQQKQSLRY